MGGARRLQLAGVCGGADGLEGCGDRGFDRFRGDLRYVRHEM
jgi:hypothetical protein